LGFIVAPRLSPQNAYHEHLMILEFILSQWIEIIGMEVAQPAPSTIVRKAQNVRHQKTEKISIEQE